MLMWPALLSVFKAPLPHGRSVPMELHGSRGASPAWSPHRLCLCAISVMPLTGVPSPPGLRAGMGTGFPPRHPRLTWPLTSWGGVPFSDVGLQASTQGLQRPGPRQCVPVRRGQLGELLGVGKDQRPGVQVAGSHEGGVRGEFLGRPQAPLQLPLCPQDFTPEKKAVARAPRRAPLGARKKVEPPWGSRPTWGRCIRRRGSVC